MNTNKLVFFVVALSLSVALASCRNCENDNDSRDGVDETECDYENPIDSIVHNTNVDFRTDEVFKYLMTHPDFVSHSDSVGYHRYSSEDYDRCALWKDCGNLRVYSIPCPIFYATSSYNIIQFRNSGKLDTAFLHETIGQLDEFYEVRSRNGEVYYILKTNAYAIRHGEVIEEYIYAFSIEDGRFKKEKLFHANGKEYDMIAVSCGNEHHNPLDFSSMVLICLSHFDDDGLPAFVVAEINENDWPTGYGLKYQWNGDLFEYVGKCPYDVEGYFE